MTIRAHSAEPSACGWARAERLRLGTSRSLAARRAVAAVCAAALVAGCGGDDPPKRADGPLGPDARLQTATCRHWLAAPAHQRWNTVDRLEEVAAGPRREGVTLHDDAAYDTLQARCRPDFARGFLLYHLYNSAAGFRSLAEEAAGEY
jgi:hypothetical protein